MATVGTDAKMAEAVRVDRRLDPSRMPQIPPDYPSPRPTHIVTATTLRYVLSNNIRKASGYLTHPPDLCIVLFCCLVTFYVTGKLAGRSVNSDARLLGF